MSNVGGVGGPRLGSVELGNNATVEAVATSGQTVGFGARGEIVRALQAQLVKLGYLAASPTAADGVYGRNTQAAVAAFQRANGLAPSGNIDPATLKAIDGALQINAKKIAAGAAKPNDILFVGLGKEASHEIRDLKRTASVHGISDAAVEDKITFKVGGRLKDYDLTNDATAEQFIKDIGLTGARGREATAILKSAGTDARDETAQVIAAFAQAERGERTIERLVLSGHSVGSGVWGDENGFFEMDSMEQIAKAFPKAARQVQDFLVAGCYSSSERQVEQFREMFPNLKSAMAYGDSAPGTWTGAMVHNSIWERATRGNDPGNLDRALFNNTRKGENVATWNSVDGYQSAEPPRPLAELRAELNRLEPAAARFFTGEDVVADTQTGPLRDYYRSVQRILGNPELPAPERTRLEAKRDQTIRLIFYATLIRGRFQQAYAEPIRAGYRAVGLPVPDFSTLSRKDALAKVREFETALAGKNPKPPAALSLKPLLTDGLRELRPAHIPTSWV